MFSDFPHQKLSSVLLQITTYIYIALVKYISTCKHFVIPLNFPCFRLLYFLLMSFLFFCFCFQCLFVVGNLCKSGCRQNLAHFFLTPLPLCFVCLFFCVPTHNCLSNTSDTYLKQCAPKAGFGVVQQITFRFWSPCEKFPGERHAKL